MVRPTKKRSSVWDCFKKPGVNDKTVKCQNCNAELKYFKNTSNLHDHIKRKHPLLLMPDVEHSHPDPKEKNASNTTAATTRKSTTPDNSINDESNPNPCSSADYAQPPPKKNSDS